MFHFLLNLIFFLNYFEVLMLLLVFNFVLPNVSLMSQVSWQSATISSGSGWRQLSGNIEGENIFFFMFLGENMGGDLGGGVGKLQRVMLIVESV